MKNSFIPTGFAIIIHVYNSPDKWFLRKPKTCVLAFGILNKRGWSLASYVSGVSNWLNVSCINL